MHIALLVTVLCICVHDVKDFSDGDACTASSGTTSAQGECNVDIAHTAKSFNLDIHGNAWLH